MAAAPAPDRVAQRQQMMTAADASLHALTREEAAAIVNDAGTIPAEYTPLLISEMVDYSATLPRTELRPVRMLQSLAKHPCCREMVEKLFIELKNRLSTETNKESPEVLSLIHSRIYGLAMLLSVGFDVANRENFMFDANGNITGVKDTKRAPICDNYIKTRGSKWRPDPFTDGGKKKRKTRKRTKKSKKTLRRRRY